MIICKHGLAIDTEESCAHYHRSMSTLTEGLVPTALALTGIIVVLAAICDVASHFIAGTPLW